MKRALLFPLLPLFLLLMIPRHGVAEGARQHTHGAALWSLEGWPEASRLVASRDGQDAWRVALSTGKLESTSLPESIGESRLSVRVEATTHRLLVDGHEVWASEMEVLGRPVLSPDGRWLVVARTPHGNETAALGELWRYDLAGGDWQRLTENEVEEGSPQISPDGRRVAFLQDGDLWTIPSDRMTVEEGGATPSAFAPLQGFDHVPPETIRVKHVASANLCRPGVPDGRIDTIPFEEYVARVVPHESPPSWHLEALKAQAVAARTYAWRYVLAPAGPDYDVLDTTSHQYMCDTRYPSTDQAVAETAGQHLTSAGNLIPSLFSAENSSPTKQNLFGHTYLSAVDDPVAFGQRRYGHGQGYSQWGGKRWADRGWRYGQILRHYYSGATIEPPYGSGDPLLEIANRPPVPYLRGSALWLEVNGPTASATRAREYYRADPDAGWTIGPWAAGQSGSTAWSFLFPLAGYGDTAQDNYRVEYAEGTVPLTGESGLPVLYLGIDRTAPVFSATLTLDRVVTAPSVAGGTLRFATGDGMSGVERVGWSYGAWGLEAEAMTDTFPILADAGASGGAAIRLQPGQSGALAFRFDALAVEPAHYRVWFRLRAGEIATGTRLATLRVFDGASIPLQRGVRYLRGADFPSDGWEWFYVDVDATPNYTARFPGQTGDGYPAGHLTAVVDWRGTRPLDIDRVLLATRPSTLLGETTLPLTVPEPITLYASDGAGNGTILRCEATQGREGARRAAAPVMMDHALFLPLLSRTAPYRYHCSD